MAGVRGQVKLPSNGLVRESVEIRSMLGKDERQLAEVGTTSFERKVANLLADLVTGCDVRELTERDEMALLLWVACNSYSSVYPLEVTCEFCFKTFTEQVDLSKFEVEFLPSGFRDPVKVTLSDGTVVPVRLSRVKDAIAVEDFRRSAKGDVWLFSHAVTIDNGKSVYDNGKMLEDLPAKDVAAIRAVQEQYPHGVKMEHKFDCPRCGETGKAPVPFRLGMVFPTGAELSRVPGGLL